MSGGGSLGGSSFWDLHGTRQSAGPTPPAPGPLLQTADTSDLDPVLDIGKAVYIDSPGHVLLANATDSQQRLVKGVYLGVPGQIAISGPMRVLFQAADPPVAGALFYLSVNGPGLFVQTPPTQPGFWVVECGLVDDPTNYGIDGSALVTLRITSGFQFVVAV